MTATMHTQAMDENALAVLQRLRDDFTTKSLLTPSPSMANGDGSGGQRGPSLLENIDNESTAQLNEQFKTFPKKRHDRCD
jgi:hypothetical protein